MVSINKLAYSLHPCGYSKCAPCRLSNYEAAEIDYTCEYLDRVAKAGLLTGIFVDVGAHVGLWALSMSEWYINRYATIPHIIAIEADTDNYQKLRENATQASTGIMPVHSAAWNRDTKLLLKRRTHPARHKVIEGVQGCETDSEIRVPGVALDTVANTPEKRNIDAIKIDVEGAELLVLNGARSILTENKQLIVIVEYSADHFEEYGYRAEQLTAFMVSHGFRVPRKQDRTIINHLEIGRASCRERV